MLRKIPVIRRVLGLYFMLKAAINGDIISPASEATVIICPTIPIDVLKVKAMSVKMNPINIPTGLEESCDMNNEGKTSLFSALDLFFMIPTNLIII